MKLINIQLSLGVICSESLKREFNIITRYVESVFLCALNDPDTPFTRKFLIELLDEEYGFAESDHMLILADKYLNVSTLRRGFNISRFERSTNEKRKFILSAIVKDALTFLFQGNDIGSTSTKVNECLESNIAYLSKEAKHKKNNIVSQLRLRFNVPLSQVYLSLLNNKDGVEKQIRICEIVFAPFILSQIFNKIKWINSNLIQIANKSNEFFLMVDIETDDRSVMIKPQNRESKDVLAEMRFLVGNDVLNEIMPLS